MSQLSIGDLAQSFQLRRESTQLSRELTRLAQELTSGRVQDVREVVRGDTAGLSSIEDGIRRISAFDLAIKDVTLEVNARQLTIESIRVKTQTSLGNLLLDETLGDPQISESAAREASAGFRSIVASLNGEVNNRSLFSGTATDSPALADVETMLADIEAQIALVGAVMPEDVQTVVEAWFAPGGGFDTVGYVGGTDSLTGPALSDTETLGVAPRADDGRLRDTLVGFAMGALVDGGLFSSDHDARSSFLKSAGEQLLNAERGLADLQGEIGLDEARVERAAIEGAAERLALEQARQALIGADPYETAGQLQAVEAQIRSLYVVTSRLSQLSLTAYLR